MHIGEFRKFVDAAEFDGRAVRAGVEGEDCGEGGRTSPDEFVLVVKRAAGRPASLVVANGGVVVVACGGWCEHATIVAVVVGVAVVEVVADELLLTLGQCLREGGFGCGGEGVDGGGSEGGGLLETEGGDLDGHKVGWHDLLLVRVLAAVCAVGVEEALVGVLLRQHLELRKVACNWRG